MAEQQWRELGARLEEARSFIVASLRRRPALVASLPYIGVLFVVVERRMQRGQLIGGPKAPVPVFVPHADSFRFQLAGAGRAAAARGDA